MYILIISNCVSPQGNLCCGFSGRSTKNLNSQMFMFRFKWIILLATLSAPLGAAAAPAAPAALLGWNNLGMHCMDSDYSVFSVLPPYNTIESQLVVNGRLVTNGSGYRVTYEAVADPSGSFNSTAMGKGNFYTYAPALYGATLGPEAGLAGWAMPGPGNTPQSMLYENTNHPAAGVAVLVNWFRAEGIPLSPYDDAHNKNPYPLMRMIAWDTANWQLGCRPGTGMFRTFLWLAISGECSSST
jgi:hypothetical protein